MLTIFAYFVLSQSTRSICFYDDVTKYHCPQSNQLIHINDFDSFKNEKITSSKLSLFIASSMIFDDNKLVFDFSNFDVTDKISVQIESSKSKNIIYVDFPPNYKFATVSFINAQIEMSNHDYQFDGLILRNSTLSSFSSIKCNYLSSDIQSLPNTEKISSQITDLLLTSIIQSPSEISFSSKSTQIRFSLNISSAIASFIGSTLCLTDFNDQQKSISFHFPPTIEKVEIPVFPQFSDQTFSLFVKSVFKSSHEKLPPIEITAVENTQITILQSNFPSHYDNFLTIKGHKCNISIESEKNPFSFNLIDSNLLISNDVTISHLINTGELSIQTVNSDLIHLHIDEIELLSQSSHIQLPQSIKMDMDHLIVHDASTINFDGEGSYSVNQYSLEEIARITFNHYVSNVENVNLSYKLGSASQLIIKEFSGKDLNIIANYIGQPPAESDVDSHMNEILNFAEVPQTVNIKISFPRHHLNGFNSATNIYSVLDKSKIQLDHNLDDFNNHLCFSQEENITCPPESFVFNDVKDFAANWTTHIREVAEDIYFYLRSQYGNPINFSTVIENNNHPNIYIETSTFALLEQLYIQGELGSIVINGTANLAQIVINRFESPVMLKTPIGLFNAAIAPHSIETINCTEMPYLRLDPQALARWPMKCMPNELILENFDQYEKIQLNEKSVTLIAVDEVEIPITDARTPKFNVSTSAPSITLAANDSITQALPILQHLEMKNDNSVLNNELKSSLIDSPVNVVNFKGILNINSTDGTVPFSFHSSSFNVQNSAQQNVEFTSDMTFDDSVNFEKVTSQVTFNHLSLKRNGTLVSDKSISINEASFDVNGQTLSNVVLNKDVTVSSTTSLTIQKTQFETLHMAVNYRLGEIPYIDFGEISSQNQKLEIELNYDDSANETEFGLLEQKLKEIENVEIPIVCANNLNSSTVTVNMNSSLPQFNQSSTLIKTSFSSSGNNQNCLYISFIYQEQPAPKPDSDDKYQTLIVILSILLALSCIVLIILIVVILINRKKHKLDKEVLLVSQKPQNYVQG